MGDPRSRRNRHNGASHHDDEVSQDGSRYGDAHEARSAAHAAEERVRVLEQYIKDMSIQNMQRMQASNGAEKFEKEVKKKDEEIAKLKALVVGQGNEASETKKQLEALKREHTVLRDQFEIGCRRLVYHATRFVNENSKWDLTASTTSTISTVSTLSLTHSSSNSVASGETEDFPKEVATPSPEKAAATDRGEMDSIPLRAEDTADYCSFPSSETLSLDGMEFIRRLRSDLRRIANPDSVKKQARDTFAMNMRQSSSDSLVGEERTVESDETLKAVEERIGRVQTEMRGLYTKLGSLPDVHLIDPVQIIQTTSASLTRMLHDVDQITTPVRDAVQQSRKVLAESGPVSRRLRLAESDLKIKEQRHALKVELLEKRLGRLTSTLTSVQQETWSSRRSDDKPLEDILSAALLERDGAALANPPEEYRSFLELLGERERELRRAERQISLTAGRADQLEQQIVDLALAKFDAESAKARAEEEFCMRSQEAASRMQTPTGSPTLPGTSPNGLFEGIFGTAPPAFCNASDQVQLMAGFGLPPPPAFAMHGLGSTGAVNLDGPPPPLYQTIFPYLGQGLAPQLEELTE